MVKASVITTCFNAGDSLRRTIESVLEQDYTDFEYIVMDGGSTDGSVELARSYEECFSEKNIPFFVYSEKDNGIYEGMNHGVAHAEGEFVNFMNADDEFYDSSVLKRLFEERDWDGVGVIYGDAAETECGKVYFFTKDFSKIETRMPFSHQSVFARRSLLKEHPLNQKYRIAADYDFLLTCYQSGVRFEDAGMLICRVSLDGVSSVKIYDTFVETEEMMNSHGIYRFSEKELKKKLFMLKIKQFGMDYLPAFIKKEIRLWQRKHRGQNREIGDVEQ